MMGLLFLDCKNDRMLGELERLERIDRSGD